MKPSRIAAALFMVLLPVAPLHGQGRWSPERANAWSRQAGWLVGMNYIPRTAINQLEMWQAETFDPVTIDQEMGWAERTGFNSARVFLHDLLWQQDSVGLLDRMDRFLAVADRHHVRVMFVLLDGVWNPEPHPGSQPAPRPRVHNSGWVQSPGVGVLRDSTRYDTLRPYVQGVIRRFRTDARVLAWDLFNEPDNRGARDPANKAELATGLARRVFSWAREVDPAQPLTIGVWWGDWSADSGLAPIQRLSLEQSDVITFHNYGRLESISRSVADLERLRRPVICTEYMARTEGSTFAAVLPFLAGHRVGAINWGFVSGKTQTIFPWDSWDKPYPPEPSPWFHDVLRADGTPYDSAEVALIRRLADEARRRP